MIEIDTLVCGHIVTMDDGREIPSGAVACKDGVIHDIGDEKDLLSRYRPRRTLRAEKGVVLPGLINVHTHAPMALMRGLADDLPLMTWLTEHIFPVEAKLSADSVYYGAMLSMMEMIKSGTTSFCDMYLFAADVARAAVKMGMRGYIGEVLYDFPSPNYGDLENGFGYMGELFDQYKDSTTITVTVDPHAVYTCSPDLLVRLKDVALANRCPYVIHLAETSFEVEQCLKDHGASPVQYLQNLGLLDESVVAAHCVNVGREDIELLREADVKIAHCPESNMKLASGIAPVAEMINAGLIVGLGTDGAASNNDVDLFAEMDMAAKLQKVHCLDSTAMDAQTTLSMATTSGAGVLNGQGEIGILKIGAKADIIVVEMNKPHLTPLYNPVSHLVYAVRGSDVRHSIIDGTIVLEDGILTLVDEAQLLCRCREYAWKLTGCAC